jgi:hypothetical protein
MQDEGMGRVLKCDREKELSVKTEWKKVLKSCAFPTSEVALQLLSDTVIGMMLFLENEYSHISCHCVNPQMSGLGLFRSLI